MSGEALYERYKDALRRGHIASLRGRLEEALAAYAEAAQIAPERATPHASAGTALLRGKRPADALGFFEVALRLAPRDEAALLGRAQALAGLGRRGEAADAYSALADVRAAGGKLSDAVDAARRALEIAEGRERRRSLERLIAQLRAAEPDESGRAALEQALRILEGVAVAPVAPVAQATATPAAAVGPAPIPVGPAPAPAAPADESAAEEPADATGEVVGSEADAGAPAAGASSEREPGPFDAGPGAGPGVGPEAVPEAVPEAPAAPVPAPIPAALDRDLPDEVDTEALAREADARLDALDARGAVDRLLDLAAAHRRAGNPSAALDACYLGLSIAPDDVGLHLALVELYGDRGWSTLAAEKLDLLDRLAELDDDGTARERLAAARGRSG